MNNQEILEEVFSTPNGKKALDIIREICQYDTRGSIRDNDRQLCFFTGKVAVYEEILAIMNNKGKINGKRTDNPEW